MMEMTGVNEAVEVAQLILMFLEKGFNASVEAIRISGHVAKKPFEVTKTIAAFCYKKYKENENDPNHVRAGETSLKDMIDLCNKKRISPKLMQLDKSELETFKKYAKDNSLSYTIMPDLNSEDEYIEIMYPSSQSAMYDIYMDAYADIAKPYSLAQYRDAARDEDVKKISEELKEDYMYIDEAFSTYEKDESIQEEYDVSPEEDIVITPDRLTKLADEKYSITLIDENGKACHLIIDSYKVSIINEDEASLHLGDREIMQYPDMDEITIDKGTLLVRENDESYFTKIPGTKGKEYLVIKKAEANEINQGKTIRTRLDKSKMYEIYDKSGKHIKDISAKELYENHYDRVLTSIDDIKKMNINYLKSMGKTIGSSGEKNNIFVEINPEDIVNRNNGVAKITWGKEELYIKESSIINNNGHLFISLKKDAGYKLFDKDTSKDSGIIYSVSDLLSKRANQDMKDLKIQKNTDRVQGKDDIDGKNGRAR